MEKQFLSEINFEVSCNKINNLFFLQIGANDGVSDDPINALVRKYNWSGILIEPGTEAFIDLQNNYKDYKEKLIFENAAITDKDGDVILYCGTTTPHFTLEHEKAIHMFDVEPKEIKVSGLTPTTLLNKHNIKSIDLLQIDAEAHDYTILSNFPFKTHRPKIVRFECVNLNNNYNQCIELIDKNNYKIYFSEDGADIIALCKDFFSLNTEMTSNIVENKTTVKSNLTIVTGIWDLKRDQAGEGFKRPFQHYIDNFIKLLKTDVNMVIFIDKEHESLVWEHRQKNNTRVVHKSVQSFKDNFAFYDKIQEIRKDSKWLNGAHWLKDSTQASLEMYNPMVMSKFFMLHDAVCYNMFDTDYYAWVDGGITNTVHEGYFTHDKVFDNVTDYLHKLFFISFPYIGNEEIHGFGRDGMNKYCQTDYVKYVCRGGFFGGHKDYIRDFNGIYYNILDNTLNEGYMGTEESIFTIMSHIYPDVCARHMIEDNGLIGTFFENVKNKKVDIIQETKFNPIVNPKVGMYVISFNSPKQFETLIKSYSDHKDFIKNTKNYLLDNSTDLSTTEEYKNLCVKYNFEHIKKDNLGICGGRQFIAEHFDTTDLDYYIFLEDDMNLMPENNNICLSGFKRYTPDLFEKVLYIINNERYDFLKFSFTEFYGTNSTQWSWYNIPQAVREKFFPEKTKLPQHGTDPNAPKTKFNNIKTYQGLPYADGEIYYCNWPQIVSREGNKKMFLDTKWAHPYEQTWMSYMFQQTKDNNIKGALLLLSPINHDRFFHYDGKQRKES